MTEIVEFGEDNAFERAVRSATGIAHGPVGANMVRGIRPLELPSNVLLSSLVNLPAGTLFRYGTKGNGPYGEGLAIDGDVIYGSLFQVDGADAFVPGIWNPYDNHVSFIPGRVTACAKGMVFTPGVFPCTPEGPLFVPGILRGPLFAGSRTLFNPGLYLTLRNPSALDFFATLAGAGVVSSFTRAGARTYARTHSAVFLPGSFANAPSLSPGRLGSGRDSGAMLDKARHKMSTLCDATTTSDAVMSCVKDAGMALIGVATVVGTEGGGLLLWAAVGGAGLESFSAGYNCAKAYDELFGDEIEFSLDAAKDWELDPPEMELVPLVPSSESEDEEEGEAGKEKTSTGTPADPEGDVNVPSWIIRFLETCGLIPESLKLRPFDEDVINKDPEHGVGGAPQPVKVKVPGNVDPASVESKNGSGQVVVGPSGVIDPMENSVPVPASWSPVTDPSAMGLAASLGAGQGKGNAGGPGRNEMESRVMEQVMAHALSTSYSVQQYYQKIVDGAKVAGLRRGAYSGYEEKLSWLRR